MSGRRSSRLFSLAVVTLVAALAGLFTFAVARDLRTPPAQAGVVRVGATSTAYASAKASAYRAGFAAAYREGWVRGAARAHADATRAGRTAGRVEAARRAAAAEAARNLLAVATAGVPRSAARTTDRCVQVGGGLCEVLGPGATGRACPTQSVPDARDRVVCVPQILLQESFASTIAPLAR